jgi:hypothetical protein
MPYKIRVVEIEDNYVPLPLQDACGGPPPEDVPLPKKRFLIAQRPDHDYRVGLKEDGSWKVIRSNQRQVVVAETMNEMMALLEQKCSMVGPVIALNWFPDPVSCHCFECGEFIEMPRGGDGSGWEDPWLWTKKGDIHDFIFHHRHHAKNLIAGWGFPVDAPPLDSQIQATNVQGGGDASSPNTRMVVPAFEHQRDPAGWSVVR